MLYLNNSQIMSKKSILFTVGAVLCVMAAIASVGWVVATEISKNRQAVPAEMKRPVRTGQEMVRRPDQEIVVKDKTSAKQMLDVLNQDVSSLERDGVE